MAPLGPARAPRRQWLRRQRRRVAEGGAEMKFGLRLLGALVGSFLILGAVSYVLIAHRLENQLIDGYATSQHADAETFQKISRRTPDRADAIRQISIVLDAIGRRPGTLEALLIDADRVVVASPDADVVGERDTDPRIEAAFDDRTSYAGHEADAELGTENFEFIAPVDLRQGAYVYEVAYDADYLDAQLSGVRHTL